MSFEDNVNKLRKSNYAKSGNLNVAGYIGKMGKMTWVLNGHGLRNFVWHRDEPIYITLENNAEIIIPCKSRNSEGNVVYEYNGSGDLEGLHIKIEYVDFYKSDDWSTYSYISEMDGRPVLDEKAPITTWENIYQSTKNLTRQTFDKLSGKTD